MKDYLPYVVGALLGALLAYIVSSIFALQGTPQLLAFGFLPALGGAVAERISNSETETTDK